MSGSIPTIKYGDIVAVTLPNLPNAADNTPFCSAPIYGWISNSNIPCSNTRSSGYWPCTNSLITSNISTLRALSWASGSATDETINPGVMYFVIGGPQGTRLSQPTGKDQVLSGDTITLASYDSFYLNGTVEPSTKKTMYMAGFARDSNTGSEGYNIVTLGQTGAGCICTTMLIGALAYPPAVDSNGLPIAVPPATTIPYTDSNGNPTILTLSFILPELDELFPYKTPFSAYIWWETNSDLLYVYDNTKQILGDNKSAQSGYFQGIGVQFVLGNAYSVEYECNKGSNKVVYGTSFCEWNKTMFDGGDPSDPNPIVSTDSVTSSSATQATPMPGTLSATSKFSNNVQLLLQVIFIVIVVLIVIVFGLMIFYLVYRNNKVIEPEHELGVPATQPRTSQQQGYESTLWKESPLDEILYDSE